MLAPGPLVRRGDGDLLEDLLELRIEVYAERPQVPVHAHGVAAADGGGAACADAVDQHHIRRLADLHRGEGKLDQALVEQQVRAFDLFQGFEAEGQGLECLAGLQHGDVKGPLQFFGRGGAAGAAADHKRTFHGVCSCHDWAEKGLPGGVKQARQQGQPAVIRSVKTSSPPPARPPNNPRSMADISRQVAGE